MKNPFANWSSASSLLVLIALISSSASIAFAGDAAPIHRGYYTYPAVRGENIVFTSEGDLWIVGVTGGVARRLTSNPGTESHAFLSADGKTVAFSADFEGPTEVYTMPVDGGLPERRSWDGGSVPAGFAPDGRLMITTARYATLPGTQIVLVNGVGAREIVPLAEAAQAAYSPDDHNLFYALVQAAE